MSLDLRYANGGFNPQPCLDLSQIKQDGNYVQKSGILRQLGKVRKESSAGSNIIILPERSIFGRKSVFSHFFPCHRSIADPKEKLLEDEVHAFNALLDEEKFDREQQLMSPSTANVGRGFLGNWGCGSWEKHLAHSGPKFVGLFLFQKSYQLC